MSREDIPASFLRHYPAEKSNQLIVSELASVCDISRTTAYKYIGLWVADNYVDFRYEGCRVFSSLFERIVPELSLRHDPIMILFWFYPNC